MLPCLKTCLISRISLLVLEARISISVSSSVPKPWREKDLSYTTTHVKSCVCGGVVKLRRYTSPGAVYLKYSPNSG